MTNFLHRRRGAIVPLFAILFPVLMIFCAMAINLAYVQLSTTEMQIAIDTAVHAGGRRLGTPMLNPDGTVQSLEEAKASVMDFASEIASMNTVAGHSVEISQSVMEFGRSTRELRDNGILASYRFQPATNSQIPSSFRIISKDLRLQHAFGPFSSANGVSPDNSFAVTASSVSTQVDRDVVLVLDRSGSMIFFEDETLLLDTLFNLSEETFVAPGPPILEYRVQFQRVRNRSLGSTNSIRFFYLTEAEFASDVPPINSFIEYLLNFNDSRERPGPDETRQKLTDEEYDDASESLYERWYTSNVIYWLERTENPNHTLGDEPDTWTDGLTIDEQREQLTGHMALYAHDYNHRYKLNNPDIFFADQIDIRQAPAFSRWYHLDRGVSVFLNVLGGGRDPDGQTLREGTVQTELVSLLPFNASPDTINIRFRGVDYFDNNPDFDYGLQDDGFTTGNTNSNDEKSYDVPHPGSSISIRNVLADVCPYGGTAIGDSLRESIELIQSASVQNPNARSRPFAAKTVVVLTDGNNTVGDDPVDVARDELANQDVTVHTITFTPGVSAAGKNAMAQVADFGRGQYYHTDVSEDLARIFEEIANNLPTILTQ